MVDSIGYSPVGMLATSDHRAIFISFSAHKLFGSSTHIDHLTSRNVQSNNKQSVTTFVEHMYAHLLEHNVFNQSQHLENE
jgi:hypothetical protein